MILHSVRVENWRSIRNAFDLADLDPGLNLVFGPNEAGKSTLMDAVCRGFFDRHTTAGGDMLARQTWGTSLGPTVTIEFETGGMQYQLAKRFIDDRRCELRRMHNGTWERIAQGQTADEQIVALVSGNNADRGMTKPEHWGLGQVLWTCQGQATHLTVGEGQQARLRDALKITLDGAQGGNIETMIGEWYDRVYTQQGRFRSGQQKANVLQAEEGLTEATETVNGLRKRMVDLDQTVHDLASSEDEYDAAKRQLDQAAKDLVNKRQELETLKEKQRVYDVLEAAATQAQSAWENVNKQVNAVKAADQAVTEAVSDVAVATDGVSNAQSHLEVIRAAAQKAKANRDQCQDALKRCDNALSDVTRLVQFLEALSTLKDAQKAHEQAVKLQDKIQRAQHEVAKLKAPDSQQMTTLRKLQRQVMEKQAQVDAASLSVRVEPENPIKVTTAIDGQRTGTTQVTQVTEFKAVSTLTMAVAGVARFVVRAGESDAATIADELGKLKAKWRENIAGLAADDMMKLEALATERQGSETRISEWTDQLAEMVPVTTLAARVQTAQSRKTSLVAEDANLADHKISAAEAHEAVKQAKAKRKAADTALNTADTNMASDQENLTEANQAAMQAQKALGIATGLLNDRKKVAARLRVEDGLTDEARTKALATALLAADQARQRLAAAEKPPTSALANEVAGLDSTAAALQSELLKQSKRIGELTGVVERAGGEGLYSKLVEATENQEIWQKKLERARLDAEAIKLLWSTLQKHKSQVFEAVLQPVRHIVTTTMQQLVGPRYERIEFSEQLMPQRIRPTARDQDADVDSLSFGTREQLMLLVRLALARLLGRAGDRQCVILDDPLVNTDPGRQRAALRILEDAATDAQILIFTCHPVAYSGLSTANRYDLAALAGSVAPAASA